MAFVQINKSKIGTGAALLEVRMGSHFQSKSVATRSIYFAFTRQVIEQAGWSIISATNKRENIRIAINEGTEEDAGFLLVTEDIDRGYMFGTSKGATGNSLVGSVTLPRFSHYVLNDVSREMEPEPVEFTIDEKEHAVLIQCPDWLRYNPLSVPTKPKLIAKEVAAPVAKPGFQSTRKAQAEVAFDELMHDKVVDITVDTPRNRQERRLIGKKVAQHLRK